MVAKPLWVGVWPFNLEEQIVNRLAPDKVKARRDRFNFFKIGSANSYVTLRLEHFKYSRLQPGDPRNHTYSTRNWQWFVYLNNQICRSNDDCISSTHHFLG